MIKADDLVLIGKITKLHGIDGEVVCHFTDDVFDRGDSAFLFLELDGLPVPFGKNTASRERKMPFSSLWKLLMRLRPAILSARKYIIPKNLFPNSTKAKACLPIVR